MRFSDVNMFRNSALRKAVASAGLVVAAVAAGCGSADREGLNSQAPGATDVSAAEFASLLNGGHVRYTSEPRSPRQLGESAELIVEGSLREVIDGRLFGGAAVSFSTVTLAVEVSGVHKGAAALGDGKTVYIEFRSDGNRPADYYAGHLPQGGRIMLYLVPAPSGRGVSTEAAADPDGGRPPGAPLWQPVSRFGFLLEDGGGVAQGTGDVFAGTTLGDFIPSKESWPARADTKPAPPVTGEVRVDDIKPYPSSSG